MKKHLRMYFMAFLAMMGLSASATIVGETDNTTAFWTAFSDYYTLAPNKTLKVEFKNYSNKSANWCNWLAVVTTDADRGAEGYSEYVVLRADNWAWQGALNTGPDSTHDWYTSLTSNYVWDTFLDDMDGSDVVLTVKRLNEVVTIHADITTAGGKSYFEDFVINCGDGTQTIRAFLTCDGAHLDIDDASVTITDTETPQPEPEGLVGKMDDTTPYLGAFSDVLTLTDGQMAKFEFTNYRSGAKNWNNYVVCVGGETFDASALLIALRADNWENVQGSSEGVASNFNWDTFLTDMSVANVKTTVKYVNGKVTVHNDITTEGGTTYFEEFSKEGITGTVTTALSVDLSHLIVLKAEVTQAPVVEEGHVGYSDNSSAYLEHISDVLTLTDGKMATFEFVNYSSKANNYNNWVTCVGGETFNLAALLIALRADNWENVQGSNEGVTSNFNWDTFLADMDGAQVKVTVTYKDGKVTIHADITAPSNEQYFEEFTKEGITGTITTAMSVDHSHLVMQKAEVTDAPVTDGIKSLTPALSQGEAACYDLSGRRVDAQYKGVVIVNGKKVLK